MIKVPFSPRIQNEFKSFCPLYYVLNTLMSFYVHAEFTTGLIVWGEPH